jgi:hypothetical protein
MVILTGLLGQRRDRLELVDQTQIDVIPDPRSAGRCGVEYVRVMWCDGLRPRAALKSWYLLPEEIQHRVGRRMSIVRASIHLAARNNVNPRDLLFENGRLTCSILRVRHRTIRPQPAGREPRTNRARCARRLPSLNISDRAALHPSSKDFDAGLRKTSHPVSLIKTCTQRQWRSAS